MLAMQGVCVQSVEGRCMFMYISEFEDLRKRARGKIGKPQRGKKLLKNLAVSPGVTPLAEKD